MEGTAVHHLFSQFGFQLGRRAETGSQLRLPADRIHDFGMSVTKDHGSPGGHVIDKLVAVGIGDSRAFGFGDEQGIAAHGLERPHRAVDAAGNDFLRFLKQGL